MKYILFYIALVCSTMASTAQKDSAVNSITIKLPAQTSFNKIGLTDDIESATVTQSDSIFKIKAEYWDTAIYNPYRNTDVKFPLQLKFTDSTYASPVLHEKVVTSRYGWRKGRPHQGIDIDLVTGDSVVSILDGIVRFAKYSSGHGKTVVVRHYNGLETTYAHLSLIDVKANDTIAKGHYLGKGGNTGNSRGSHLHFVASFKGAYIHPEYLFDFSSTNAIRTQEFWITQEWTDARFHNSRRISNFNILTSKEEALASLVRQKKLYVVKKGDTLSAISQRNNLSVSKICDVNSITKTAPLKVGQKLVLIL